MRVLFFLEPVIFDRRPAMLDAHLMWAECVERAVHHAGGAFVLAANAEVCATWRRRQPAPAEERVCHVVDSFEVLAAYGCQRARYARALYGDRDEPNALTAALDRIRKAERPDLLVMTSQNALARRVLAGVPTLCIEQGPLPRSGHPLRTFFDPLGHQVGSLLETHADCIRSLPLDPEDRKRLRALLAAVLENPFRADPRALPACAALNDIRRDGPVALLVTQPPDWVTYYSGPLDLEPENLVYDWSRRLPPGWIGVPTYHLGYRLDPAMEAALARSTERLRFLPPEYAQGLTEALLLAADGMVTLCSTAAMTGLLMRRPVVVTGTSPFSAWCPADPAALQGAVPLTEAEVESTLAFLTHRYIHDHATLMADPAILAGLFQAVLTEPDPASWFLDLSTWSAGRARSLFDLVPVPPVPPSPVGVHS